MPRSWYAQTKRHHSRSDLWVPVTTNVVVSSVATEYRLFVLRTIKIKTRALQRGIVQTRKYENDIRRPLLSCGKIHTKNDVFAVTKQITLLENCEEQRTWLACQRRPDSLVLSGREGKKQQRQTGGGSCRDADRFLIGVERKLERGLHFVSHLHHDPCFDVNPRQRRRDPGGGGAGANGEVARFVPVVRDTKLLDGQQTPAYSFTIFIRKEGLDVYTIV